MESSNIIFSTPLVTICSPTTVLNCSLDGGHLIVVPNRMIADRVECTALEAIQLMAASMLAGKAMLKILGVEKINYQEMGNWSLDSPDTAKLHIHVFGRHEQQRYQQRGESIKFFPKGHNIYRQVYKPITQEQLEAMRFAIQSLITTVPFTQLLSNC